MSALLEARGLTLRMGSRTLCRALDLVLTPNQSLAILGRNGAGKTTLLHTLAGLRAPESGAVWLAGQPYAAHAPKDAAQLRGVLMQHHADALAATALETALIGRHPHLSRWAVESEDDLRIARAALAAVGLAGFETRRADSLSGGERQRLAIATLLTQQPALRLLDEPLTHLDLGAQIPLLDLLSPRQQGGATVMVMHDPTLAARFCDVALLLFDDGEWRLGGVDEVITPDALARLHGHPFHELHHDGRRVFVPA